MPKFIELTTSDRQTKDTSDDITVLVNADLIIKIDDTEENYAGDTRVQFVDGSALYVSETLAELKAMLVKP